MENKALKGFGLFMSIAVFLVIMLAVGRLFRIALFVFGASGIIMLVWMLIILQADAQRNKQAFGVVANTDLQRKLLRQRKQCAREIQACKDSIAELEGKASYFISKLFANCELAKGDSENQFLNFDRLAETYAYQITPVLLDNCKTIVAQHRSEIRTKRAEERYWMQLDAKYEQAFAASKRQEERIEELAANLKKRQKSAEEDDKLLNEMQAYMNEHAKEETDGLGKAVYENMHFAELKQEMQLDMQTQIEELEATKQQIIWLEEQTNSFYELKKEYATHKPDTSAGLYEDIERLSDEMKDL